MDSLISIDLLLTIFIPRTPLHDGAVIIDGNRIVAASCLLPLSPHPSISHSLGTRHRAAIGLTEETDASVIVVSEETGQISIASSGKINRNIDSKTLNRFLQNLYIPARSQSLGFFQKLFKKYIVEKWS